MVLRTLANHYRGAAAAGSKGLQFEKQTDHPQGMLLAGVPMLAAVRCLLLHGTSCTLEAPTAHRASLGVLDFCRASWGCSNMPHCAPGGGVGDTPPPAPQRSAGYLHRVSCCMRHHPGFPFAMLPGDVLAVTRVGRCVLLHGKPGPASTIAAWRFLLPCHAMRWGPVAAWGMAQSSCAGCPS